MAKGLGWAMAAVMGSLNVAHLREEVLVCPICGGPMEPGSMTEQFKCQSGKSDDMPRWLEDALEDQGYSPWSYYPQDGAIDALATAANGVELIPMRDRGLFGGWQFDGVPEGEITFPEWFPIQKRDAYVEERFEAWGERLEELLLHPDVDLSGDDLDSTHPALLIARAEGQIARAEAVREEKARRARKRAQDQENVDFALAEEGFFDGRLGLAKLPEDCTLLSSQSAGCRSNPHILAAGPRMTVDQFRELVCTRGDYSEVVEVNHRRREVVVASPNPGQWIGRGGAIAKALGRALGYYVKVVEK